MAKIQLTPKQVFGYVILGIKNKQYQAAINLAQDCIYQLDAQEESNKPPDQTPRKPCFE